LWKSFGFFGVFEYNKSMKKWTKVLLGILMIVPMLVGMVFALPVSQVVGMRDTYEKIDID